jgi:hypothetical protein
LRELAASSDLDVLNFILKRLVDGPVLLYCTKEFLQFLNDKEEELIYVNSAVNVDINLLRKLHERSLKTGKY